MPYKKGTVEEYAAIAFFKINYGQSAKHLHVEAKQERTMSVDAFEDYGNHLGNAIKMVMSLMSREAIILGGSIARAYPFFWKSMKATIADFEYAQQRDQTTIIASQHEDMGIIGAAALIGP